LKKRGGEAGIPLAWETEATQSGWLLLHPPFAGKKRFAHSGGKSKKGEKETKRRHGRVD